MDYSAISQDPADPAGTSPWGSPRADRTTFATAGHSTDVPSSPLPSNHRSPYDNQHHESPSAAGNHTGEPPSPDLSAQLQNAQLGDHDYVEQPQHTTPQPQAKAQAPARYQTGARQNARPPAPTYRLQGKISALERTGKKDPILRFDVYVCVSNVRDGTNED
jgi:hypothetical protein